jgi:diguanylate cyclase (GGDEF)-like protein
MAPGPRDQDQPVMGRESLFRKKLNQLRTDGHLNALPNSDSARRTRELEKSNYLETLNHTLVNQDPVEMDRLTLLDGLTELYNHKSIVRILKDELKRSRRYKYATTVLLLRVDGFHEINGKFGHLASNGVLKGTANFLMSTIRDVDIPGRYDGETFVVVCPQTDLAGASVLAERVRSRIFTERISDIGQNWSVTVSQGLAAFPVSGTKEDELFRSAFNALTDAQRRGGNTYSLSEAEQA